MEEFVGDLWRLLLDDFCGGVVECLLDVVYGGGVLCVELCDLLWIVGCGRFGFGWFDGLLFYLL